jgi:hypothetical protein
MRSIISQSLLFGICGLIAALAPLPAFAQLPFPHHLSGRVTVEEGMTTLPLVITRPGVYVLRRDITVPSGDAVTITAHGVTLDLNGHTISTRAEQTGRGIFVKNVINPTVKNGKVREFAVNVAVEDSVNVVLEYLQITGEAVPATSEGPSEIGISLVNARNAVVRDNNIAAVNLGVFVRGEESTGNRIFQNAIVGGGRALSALLGICYNPAPGAGPNDPGPRGDTVSDNHIARFNYGISVSPGSVSNIFRNNTLASFTGSFQNLGAFTTGGGTNVSFQNLEVLILPTNLPCPADGVRD